VIRQLEFATPFVYSTKGTAAESIRSQQLRDRIKGGDSDLFAQIAEHVAQLNAEGAFPGFFGSEVMLVPVPGHAPLARGARLISGRIAGALTSAGLGAGVSELLARVELVPKSAFASPAERPKTDAHYRSIEVTSRLARPHRILLVDDVVTRGATLLGSASRLAEAFPGVDIRAFALLRPVTEGEISTIRQPCVGTIEMDELGACWRRP
jgi:hypothetical protein